MSVCQYIELISYINALNRKIIFLTKTFNLFESLLQEIIFLHVMSAMLNYDSFTDFSVNICY